MMETGGNWSGICIDSYQGWNQNSLLTFEFGELWSIVWYSRAPYEKMRIVDMKNEKTVSCAVENCYRGGEVLGQTMQWLVEEKR